MTSIEVVAWQRLLPVRQQNARVHYNISLVLCLGSKVYGQRFSLLGEGDNDRWMGVQSVPVHFEIDSDRRNSVVLYAQIYRRM